MRVTVGFKGDTAQTPALCSDPPAPDLLIMRHIFACKTTDFMDCQPTPVVAPGTATTASILCSIKGGTCHG